MSGHACPSPYPKLSDLCMSEPVSEVMTLSMSVSESVSEVQKSRMSVSESASDMDSDMHSCPNSCPCPFISAVNRHNRKTLRKALQANEIPAENNTVCITTVTVHLLQYICNKFVHQKPLIFVKFTQFFLMFQFHNLFHHIRIELN